MNTKDMITTGDIEKAFGDYGKEDYLTSPEPYTVLYESTKDLDRLEQNIVMNTVKHLAKKAGCPNTVFMEMLRAVEEQRERVLPDNGGFPGLKDLLGGKEPDYGGYFCSGDGIYQYDERSGTFREICGHPIFPTRRYVSMDIKEERLDISYFLDGRWEKLKMVPRQILSEASQISSISKLGLDITSENARNMVNYLRCMDVKNRNIIPRAETTGRMGWHEDRGFVPYIPGVIYDDEKNYREMFSAIHKKGELQEWVNLAKAVRANKENPAGRFMLAASVASVILPWTCNQTFMVHLWSPVSGTGKTLALMLAASVWADPTMGKYVKPLNSSDTALEQMENFCNNLPLCLDELESVRNRDFSYLVYMLCEGMGRNRSTKNLGIREQSHWMNIILTNGEHPITDDSRGGSINRVISVESTGPVFPGGNEELSKAAEKMMNNYGHAGEMIVKAISSDPQYVKVIRKAYESYRSLLLEKATGKQASYGAALLVGDWLLDMIVIGDDKCLTVDDILAVLATPEMTDMNLRAQSIVCDFMAVNSSCFAHESSGDDLLLRGPLYGKMTNGGRVFFIQTALKKVLNDANINFTAFMKWCLGRKLIQTCYDENRNRHWGVMTKLPGMENSLRAICFLPEFFRNMDKESGMTIVETEPGMPFADGGE